ncbi:MAG: GH25 family lysozyme [Oscillospiraceae bacterium]|nr:GH25 family lysozyme [Oscillospiraceae bacterium]
MQRTILAWCCLLLVCAILVLLILSGRLWFNMPSRTRYPVRGVDVSHYQGKIDWDVIAQQDITFAFIKATEGSGTVDECFADNWEASRNAGLYTGAYHFFSFDSGGDTQAENFIQTVPVQTDALPPVIDLEYYRSENLPTTETVRENLQIMLDALTRHYGKTPIIYTTNQCYEEYLKGTDMDYILWIRSVFTPPSSKLEPEWSFWQYNPRGLLDGYEGDEQFIDLNAYCGTMEEFIAQFNTAE